MPDDLEGQLRAGAEAVEVGRFRIDSRRALEKLRQYRLADPHHYVLELLRAAVASGATFVDARADADDFELTFDGRPFPPPVLRELLGHALVGGDDPEIVRARLLSLGLAGALGLQPSWIRVQSGPWRVDLDAQAQASVTQQPPLLIGSTFIHVRDRLSWRVARDALTGAREVKVIAGMASDFPVPLTVNRRRMDSLPAFSEEVLAEVDETYRDGMRVAAAIPRRHLQKTEVRVNVWGVTVTVRSLELPQVQLLALVRDDRLRRNASGSDVVEADPRYRLMMQRLREMQEKLVSRLVAGLKERDDPAAREKLLAAAGEKEGPLRQLIERAPLVPGPSGEFVSVEALRAELAAGRRLRYATRPYPHDTYTPPVVLMRGDPRALALLPAKPQVDVVREVAARERAAENRRSWDGEPEESATLKQDDLLLREPFEAEGFHGEVGLPATPPGEPTLRVLLQGRFLGLVREGLPPSTVSVVNFTRTLPASGWENPLRSLSRALERARAGLHAALLRALAASADAAGAPPGPPAPPEPPVRELCRWAVERALASARSASELGLPPGLMAARLYEMAGGGYESIQAILGWPLIRHVDRPRKHPPLRGEPVAVLRPEEVAGLVRLRGEKQVRGYLEVLEKEVSIRARLSRGAEPLALPGDALAAVAIGEGGVTGRVGLPRALRSDLLLRLHARGLFLEEVSLTPSYELALAVVASEALAPADGWARVERDASFEAALAAVRRAERQLLGPILDRLETEPFDAWPASARRYLRAFMARDLSSLPSRKDLDPLAARAAGARIFRGARGPLSLAEISASVSDGQFWVLDRLSVPDVPEGMVVVLADPVLSASIRTVAGARAEDATEELDRLRVRRRFQAQRARPATLDRPRPFRVPVVSGLLRGEVGAPGQARISRVLVLYQGRPVEELAVQTVLPLEAVLEVQEGLDPARGLTAGVQRSIEDAMKTAETELLLALDARWEEEPARSLLWRALGGRLDGRLPAEECARVLSRPIVPLTDGRHASVAELDSARRVAFSKASRHHVEGGLRSGEPVVRADDPQVWDLLQRWHAVDVTRQLEAELSARARRAALPRQETFRYPGAALRRFPLERDGLRGEIALLEGAPGVLELYHEGRPLCLLREEALPASGVAVTVNDDRLVPTPDETDVARDGAYRHLLKEIAAELDRVGRALAAEWPALADADRRALTPALVQLAVWGATGTRKPARSPLWDLELLETTGGAPLSMKALLGRGGKGERSTVLWSNRSGTLLEPDRVVWRPRPGELALLSALGVAHRDVTAELKEAEERRARARQDTLDVPVQSAFREKMPAPRSGEVVLPGEPAGRLELTLFKDGMRLEHLSLEHPVGAVARVEDPALRPARGWRRASRNAAFRAVREAVEAAMERALVRRLESRDGGWLPYARAAVRWRAGGSGPVASALPSLELFSDLDGRPVTLGAVMAEHGRRGVVAVVDPALADAARPEHLVLAKTGDTLELLEALGLPADDLSDDIRSARVLEESRRARRLQALHYPGEAVVRVAVDQPGGFRGQLALPAEEDGGGGGEGPAIVLAREGVAVTRHRVDDLGVAGVLDHPGLEVSADWQSATLSAEQRRALLQEVDFLGRRLAADAPHLPERHRGAALRFVLRFLRRRGMADASHLSRLDEVAQRLAEAPLFRTCDGRQVGLKAVASQAQRRRGVFVLKSRLLSPDVGDELVLEAERLDEPWIHLLGEVLGQDRVRTVEDLGAWKEAQARADPDAHTPLWHGLERLRREANLLRTDEFGRLSVGELREIRLHRRGGRGAPVRYDSWRHEATLDPEHPVVRRALEEAAARPEGVYVLLAAIFGAVNRAFARVTDQDEARMLASLLAHLAQRPDLLERKT
jgi:hypothetical protein